MFLLVLFLWCSSSVLLVLYLVLCFVLSLILAPVPSQVLSLCVVLSQLKCTLLCSPCPRFHAQLCCLIAPPIALYRALVLTLVCVFYLFSALSNACSLASALTTTHRSDFSNALPRALLIYFNQAHKSFFYSSFRCSVGCAVFFSFNTPHKVSRIFNQKANVSYNNLFPCSHKAPQTIKPSSVLLVIKLALGSQYSHSIIKHIKQCSVLLAIKITSSLQYSHSWSWS